MVGKNLLEGKRILIVDDEPDVLETLEDLLPMGQITTAASFKEAKTYLESEAFDLTILDIMGVAGYDLLKIAVERNTTAVMLTARALGPQNVKKSFKEGAAYYIPKEEMIHIESHLNDILEAKEKGQSTWGHWFERMATYCEKNFKPGWQKEDKIFWEKFPFH